MSGKLLYLALAFFLAETGRATPPPPKPPVKPTVGGVPTGPGIAPPKVPTVVPPVRPPLGVPIAPNSPTTPGIRPPLPTPQQPKKPTEEPWPPCSVTGTPGRTKNKNCGDYKSKTACDTNDYISVWCNCDCSFHCKKPGVFEATTTLPIKLNCEWVETNLGNAFCREESIAPKLPNWREKCQEVCSNERARCGGRKP
jgi:hypothetical protein